ncbi:MAG TPA: 2-oxoacid:acceptor oxidoreductase family protein, partial [Candidatus Syntrophosphaera sp.]|nr:2-oxoacid:acceptor oxidoreductase family protein [Candidatus Syntrophosphaera sp.]
EADMILSVEPMEALRYLPYLAPDGWIIANKTLFKNIPNYPVEDKIYAEITRHPHHVLIDADSIAKEVKATRAMNIVMLGAAVEQLGFSPQEIETAIREIFNRKGEQIVEANLRALKAGLDA